MRFFLCAALVAVTSASAFAAAPKPARLGLCATCHGEDGIARMPGTPHLAGQDRAYLRAALDAYRDGRRDVPAMRAAVGALTADELDALADWYAARPRCAEPSP